MAKKNSILAYISIGAGACSYAYGDTTLDAVAALKRIVDRDWCTSYKFDEDILSCTLYDVSRTEVWDSGDHGIRDSETKLPLMVISRATFRPTYPAAKKRAGNK